MFEGYKVGLALSGGGAKGIAHLGVLKVLEERGIEVDYLSGVSAGAIMGALYADGNTPEDICQYIKKSDMYHMLSLTMPRHGGITRMDQFGKFIKDKIKAETKRINGDDSKNNGMLEDLIKGLQSDDLHAETESPDADVATGAAETNKPA